ncbi:MAG: ABC transporter ATP-binding protein, partial [Candidatus Omnitrophica bacterium]|nr:ABC transporter ATP-binding protein [Candidatus Omnitrophota bacterium]
RVNKVEQLLTLVGLTEERKQILRRFSRGMLQRIGIAQALINDPKLIFLDEPITGLDPMGRKEIRNIISKVRAEGKTIFFCSHVLHDVELMCDHIGILCEGRLITTGKLDELLATKEVEISAEGLRGEALAKLEGRVKKLRKEENRIIFDVEEEALADEVVGLIKHYGGKRLSIVPKKESLEDFFLKAIGREEYKPDERREK